MMAILQIIKLNFRVFMLICSGLCFTTSCSNTKVLNAKKSSLENSDLVISKDEGNFEAHKTKHPILVDGFAKESIWEKSPWYSMNYLWMGKPVNPEDYYGKFKLAWDKNYLYILVEITDDYLNPTLKDGIENYWKGDCVEVFLDEDKSGGDHQYNHQAFAYHVTTEGHIIDFGVQKKPIFLDDNIKVKIAKENNKYTWEMAVKIYDKNFSEDSKSNKPVKLFFGKTLGFSISYGDNDGNKTRENFIGSKKSHGQNNDEGYKNADVFGSVLLVK